jgi:hypothetical protein
MRVHRRRGVRRAVLVAAAALCGVVVTSVSCAEFGTGVGDISYIAFDGVPYPALIAGDSMRDALGGAAPFTASAFDAAGRLIVDADFTFFTLDTGVVIGADGVLRATTRRDGVVRVVAALDGLQSQDRTVRVVRRPDAVRAETPLSLDLPYVIPDSAPLNVAPEMRVRVVSGDSLDIGPNVGGWLVRWRVVHAGDTLAATDTALVALQTTNGLRSTRDTTTAEGTSSRRLRVFANRIVVPSDSFVVLADVDRHGTPLAGSPIRFVVRIAPVQPPP